MNNSKAKAINTLAWVVLILGILSGLFLGSAFETWGGDYNISVAASFIVSSIISFITLQGFAELIELLDNSNTISRKIVNNFNELSSNLKEVQKTLDNLDENISKIKKSFPSISDEQ